MSKNFSSPTEELRSLIQEAHSLLRDIRTEKKLLVDLFKQLEAKLTLDSDLAEIFVHIAEEKGQEVADKWDKSRLRTLERLFEKRFDQRWGDLMLQGSPTALEIARAIAVIRLGLEQVPPEEIPLIAWLNQWGTEDLNGQS